MRLTKSLFLSWFLITTPTKSLANDNDIILNKGDKAPFYGVLVDQDQYRKFTEGMRTEDFVNAHPSDLKPHEGMSENEKILIGIMAGFSAGIILMISK